MTNLRDIDAAIAGAKKGIVAAVQDYVASHRRECEAMLDENRTARHITRLCREKSTLRKALEPFEDVGGELGEDPTAWTRPFHPKLLRAAAAAMESTSGEDTFADQAEAIGSKVDNAVIESQANRIAELEDIEVILDSKIRVLRKALGPFEECFAGHNSANEHRFQMGCLNLSEWRAAAAAMESTSGEHGTPSMIEMLTDQEKTRGFFDHISSLKKRLGCPDDKSFEEWITELKAKADAEPPTGKMRTILDVLACPPEQNVCDYIHGLIDKAGERDEVGDLYANSLKTIREMRSELNALREAYNEQLNWNVERQHSIDRLRAELVAKTADLENMLALCEQIGKAGVGWPTLDKAKAAVQEEHNLLVAKANRND